MVKLTRVFYFALVSLFFLTIPQVAEYTMAEGANCAEILAMMNKIERRDKAFEKNEKMWTDKVNYFYKNLHKRRNGGTLYDNASLCRVVFQENPPEDDSCYLVMNEYNRNERHYKKAKSQVRWIKKERGEIDLKWKALNNKAEAGNCYSQVVPGEDSSDDPSGNWIVNLDDGYATYELEWDISKSGQGVWTIDQTLLDTTHSHHKKNKNKKQHSYKLTSKDGSYKFEGASSNTDPGDKGHFTQNGTLSISGDSLSGSGTHHGSKITTDFSFSGSKK